MPPTQPQNRACIALGSNLGDRRRHIASALEAIGTLPRTRMVASSSVHETAPVGEIAQGAYLNAAAVVETGLTARELLESLLSIERAHGRERIPGERWGPRTLDLDLLLYGDAVIEEAGLTVPHPRMHQRRFVLAPLAEVASDWIVPRVGKTVGELLGSLRE